MQRQQDSPNSSPIMTSYGVSFVILNFNAYIKRAIFTLYQISRYTKLLYIKNQKYHNDNGLMLHVAISNWYDILIYKKVTPSKYLYVIQII